MEILLLITTLIIKLNQHRDFAVDWNTKGRVSNVKK